MNSKNKDGKVFIYGLIDPRNNEIRYVGFTDNLKRRYSKHLSDARVGKSGHRNNWIRILLGENIIPEIVVLEEVRYEDRDSKEKHWIKKLSDGNLTNMTDGGEGMSGHKHSPESKKAISEKKKWARKDSSKYIGTYYDKKLEKWRGRVLINRENLIWLRHWDKAEEAAYEYDQAARIILGENTPLNFPDLEPDLNYTLPKKGKRNSISTSEFYGVSIDKRNGNSFSWFLKDGKSYRIGTFKNEELCGMAYDIAIIFFNQEEIYNLNFPDMKEKYINHLSKYKIDKINDLRLAIKDFINERS